MNREVIRSKQNASVKAWKKLSTGKGRKKSQSYLIEGTHLAQEAVKWKVNVKQWIMTETYYHNQIEEIKLSADTQNITLIDDSIARDLSDTPSPQGVFAEVNIEVNSAIDLNGTHYLLVDRVQDPGNLGTMIRTADAAAYDGVIIGDGSVDIYNEKVIRSTQGSIWHLPVIEMPLEEAIEKLKVNNIPVYATALHRDALSFKELPTDKPTAIIVGNEGQGVSQSIQDLSDQCIYIPMPGNAESLNVGVATGVLLFHFVKIG